MQSEFKKFLHSIKVLLNTRHPSGLYFSFSPLIQFVDRLYAEITTELLGLLKMEEMGILFSVHFYLRFILLLHFHLTSPSICSFSAAVSHYCSPWFGDISSSSKLLTILTRSCTQRCRLISGILQLIAHPTPPSSPKSSPLLTIHQQAAAVEDTNQAPALTNQRLKSRLLASGRARRRAPSPLRAHRLLCSNLLLISTLLKYDCSAQTSP